jgi:hypothetical protein
MLNINYEKKFVQ